jgi:hypothetical protein
MTYEPWPSPDSRRGPLPRIEDLPVGDQGYDQEAVREAFDAFYRHAAQLDASLKALEAVEVFRRDAMELRSDLRSLRTLGFGQPEPAWAPSVWAYERPRRDVPAAVPRLAAEAALLIGVAVVAGVASFRPWLIVALMGAALAITLVVEWLAARARTQLPASLYEALVPESVFAAEPVGEPAPFVETAPPDSEVGWSAFDLAHAEGEDLAEEVSEDTRESEPAIGSGPGQPVVSEDVGADEPGASSSSEVEREPVAVAVDEREPWERGFDGDGAPQPVESRRTLARLLRRRRDGA